MLTQEEAEFVGFFMGEGCMTMRKAYYSTKLHTRSMYMPRIAISLRVDDFSLLEWIKNQFGGNIYVNKKWTGKREIRKGNLIYTQNPTVQWQVCSVKECMKIVELLEQSKIPSQKYKQVSLFKKFLEMKVRGKRYGKGGRWYSDQELDEIEKIKLQLSSSKIFS